MVLDLDSFVFTTVFSFSIFCSTGTWLGYQDSSCNCHRKLGGVERIVNTAKCITGVKSKTNGFWRGLLVSASLIDNMQMDGGVANRLGVTLDGLCKEIRNSRKGGCLYCSFDYRRHSDAT